MLRRLFVLFMKGENCMEKLIVNFEAIQGEVNRLNDLLEDYRILYGKLFNVVDQSSLYWKGKDQETYIRKIHESESYFEKMFQLLQQYISFIEKSLKSYRLCQDEAEASIRRL